jgi:hypothetical protein
MLAQQELLRLGNEFLNNLLVRFRDLINRSSGHPSRRVHQSCEDLKDFHLALVHLYTFERFKNYPRESRIKVSTEFPRKLNQFGFFDFRGEAGIVNLGEYLRKTRFQVSKQTLIQMILLLFTCWLFHIGDL